MLYAEAIMLDIVMLPLGFGSSRSTICITASA
jgi:hypothetical protein